MNIALFSPTWPPASDASGIATYCAHMKLCLEQTGHRVFILCRNLLDENAPDAYRISFDPSILEAYRIKLVAKFSPGYEQYIYIAKALLATIREIEKAHKIDLFELEESFGWHYFLAKRVNFPIVMRLHGPHFLDCKVSGKIVDKFDLKRYIREQRAFMRARYVNAPSQWVIDEVQRAYKPAWEMVEVFGNPIKPINREKCWNFSACTQFQILFVGRFDLLKGGDVLIEAFAKVLDKQPLATLVFAGPDKGVLQRDGNRACFDDMVNAHIPEQYRSQITFLGKVDRNKLTALRLACHISMTASRSEVFGYTVLESMAVGVPVVAPQVAGVSELFEHSNSGLFFESGNPEDAASKLLSLMQHQSVAINLGKNGYQHCCDTFSLNSIANKAISYYQKVVDDYAVK